MKLLKFQASWCQPCKVLTSILNTMQIPFPVEVIDADENKDMLQKYNVRSVPVLILLDENNNEIDRLTGSTTKDKITALLNKELL
mgnify:FL=1